MPFVQNAAKLRAGCSITSDPTLSLKNTRDQPLTFGAILSSDNWESFILETIIERLWYRSRVFKLSSDVKKFGEFGNNTALLVNRR